MCDEEKWDCNILKKRIKLRVRTYTEALGVQGVKRSLGSHIKVRTMIENPPKENVLENRYKSPLLELWRIWACEMPVSKDASATTGTKQTIGKLDRVKRRGNHRSVPLKTQKKALWLQYHQQRPADIRDKGILGMDLLRGYDCQLGLRQG